LQQYMQTGVDKHMQTALKKKRGVQHVFQEPYWKQGTKILWEGMLRTLPYPVCGKPEKQGT